MPMKKAPLAGRFSGMAKIKNIQSRTTGNMLSSPSCGVTGVVCAAEASRLARESPCARDPINSINQHLDNEQQKYGISPLCCNRPAIRQRRFQALTVAEHCILEILVRQLCRPLSNHLKR
nr:hypothetical protein [uncultured Desulfovibrio sp.]